jgi:hypothetical protein
MAAKLYTINSEYLEQLLSTQGRALVGKLLKRHEICSDPTILKSETKELVYESFREFKALLEAHQYGYEMSVFEFTTKKKEGNV